MVEREEAMTIQPYESGSQVAMGRELGKAMVAKWIAEGKAAAVTGDTAGLWNIVQWAAYHITVVLPGEGAPTCGATWAGEYSDVLPADQRDDYIGK